MRRPLAEGAVGLLEIHLQGGCRTEMFRVCRVTPIAGAGMFHVGVEFLSVPPAGETSVRAELEASHAAGASTALPARARALSGWVLTSSARRTAAAKNSDPETREKGPDSTSLSAATARGRNGVAVAQEGCVNDDSREG
jgi:hypothetical protein